MTNLSLEQRLRLYREDDPLEMASTAPACWYTDTEIAQLEQDAVFARSWQFVGRVEQAVAPGQYFRCQVAGDSLIVVRGADRVLRAFYNVCRHHAAAVAVEPTGCVQSFRCPYHGWNYALDGKLKGAPEFMGVCNFNPENNGLVPARVDVWEQFVFVSLDPDAIPLLEWLGDMGRDLSNLGISELHFLEQRIYTLDCNWKVFVDNYLDGGYHVPHLHKGLNSVLDYSHYTIENGERHCLQSSPVVAPHDNSEYSETRTGTRAYYYWLYPNFMLNLYEGIMDTNLVIPIGIDKTKVVFDFYFAASNESSPNKYRDSIAISDRIQQEDVDICESVQRGLSSRAYGAGRLSVRREAGEHLFHRLLSRDLKTTIGVGRQQQ
jgi:choline monooxygenase